MKSSSYVGAIGAGDAFQERTLQTVMTSVNCRGDEDNIFDCSHKLDSRCDPFEDAHVVCQGIYSSLYARNST